VIAYRLLALSLFSTLVAAAVAPGALAQFSLTGSWEGRWSCQGFDGAKFRSSNGQSTVLITQTDNTLAVNMDEGDYLYNGAAIPDGSSPTTKGEIVLSQCGTDNLPLAGPDAEVLRAKVKADAEKGTGSIDGLSILESAIPDVLTCKYSYKRVSTTDPAVAACP
jgi:hypothetical protein